VPVPEPTPSALEARLRREAERALKEFGADGRVESSTYGVLAERAAALEARLAELGAAPDELAAVAAQRRTLEGVDRQRSGADASPAPPKSAVYGAAVNVTELESMTASLALAGDAWRRALLDHLRSIMRGDPDAARDRLALSLAALLRRARLRPVLAVEGPRSAELDVGGWRVALAFGVCGDDTGSSARWLSEDFARRGRVGLIALECGGAIEPPAGGIVRGADDRAVMTALGERLGAFLLDRQPAIAEAVSPDHAFGVIAHATLAGLNVASGRLIFAECWRIANLCDLDDPRVEHLQRLMRAIERSRSDEHER